jgi:transcriptional regulator with XRE-family HTH domain
MATRERRNDRAERLADEALSALGRQLRIARVGSGLSQRTLEASSGISHSEICRIERGRAPNVPHRTLVVLATSLGLVIPARPYPEGDALRDAGHARLLERLRVRLHPSLRWRTEVPLPNPGDRRSWDAITGAGSWRAGVEAETVIDDTQALERRLSLKRRDGGVDHVILLVADTPRNRRALAAAPAAFSDLPLATREILTELGAGRDPGGSGIVIL